MLGQKIILHILENYLDGDDQDFKLDTPLLELNIIDSGSLFDLVEWLRRETGSVIPLSEVKPSNFSSVQAMLDMVERL